MVFVRDKLTALIINIFGLHKKWVRLLIGIPIGMPFDQKYVGRNDV